MTTKTDVVGTTAVSTYVEVWPINTDLRNGDPAEEDTPTRFRSFAPTLVLDCHGDLTVIHGTAEELLDLGLQIAHTARGMR